MLIILKKVIIKKVKNMKKLINLILIGIMMVPMSINAQQDTKSFVQQYKHKDGFTVVNIGKPAIRMVGMIAKVGREEQLSQILKSVDALRVLSFNCEWDKSQTEHFNCEALFFCDAYYDELIEVVDNNETVKIFGKIENNAITEMIILSCSSHSSVDMVCISGKFAFDDIQSLCGNFGKKIAGI
jgi:hypothetical protein